jgi:hypothetical protein
VRRYDSRLGPNNTEPPSKSAAPMRGLTGKIILFAATVLITLTVVEIGLRLFGKDLVGEPITGNEYLYYRFDRELGWSNGSNVRGTLVRSEFSHQLRFNNYGMRGRDVSLAKPLGLSRIAVLGDSFAWGWGVEEPELFTTIIEQEIPNTEVLNFAVPGYGPVQYYLQTSKVLSFNPDVVVIVFCLGNDFIDNVYWERYGYYKPFARLDEKGEVVIDGYPIPDVKFFSHQFFGQALLRGVHDRLYFVRLFDTPLKQLASEFGMRKQNGPPVPVVQSDFFYRPDAPEVRWVISINTKLFEKIASAYRTRGVPVVVVAAPSKCELGSCFPKTPSDAARKALARSLSGLPITMIDPTPAFNLDDFWSKDPHWRASGHHKIADALVPELDSILKRKRPITQRE